MSTRVRCIVCGVGVGERCVWATSHDGHVKGTPRDEEHFYRDVNARSEIRGSCRSVDYTLRSGSTWRNVVTTYPAARFIVTPDAFNTPTTIWSADPDRPAVVLQRHQLPHGDLGDALWDLIVGAVDGAR